MVRVSGSLGRCQTSPGGVGVFAEDGEAFADVGDVGVGVRLVGVAQDAGGLAGEGGGEDPVAEVGLGAAARPEVVRGASDGDLDPAGLVGGEQLAGHLAAELALLGVRRIGAGLGQRPAGRAPVHVDVLHADQPGPVGLGGGEDAGLQAGELLGPRGVGRVEGLVDHLRAPATSMVNFGSAASPPTTSTPSGTRACPERLTIRTRLAAAEQGVQGGEADRAGAEDDVPRCAGHDCSSILVAADGGGRLRRRDWGQQPEQEQPGEGGEGDGAAGAEDGELLARRRFPPGW